MTWTVGFVGPGGKAMNRGELRPAPIKLDRTGGIDKTGPAEAIDEPNDVVYYVLYCTTS